MKTWQAGPMDSEGVPIYAGPTENDELIAYVYDTQPEDDTEAVAGLIVQAVNAHAALVAALEAARRYVAIDTGDTEAANRGCASPEELLIDIDAALEAARGMV